MVNEIHTEISIHISAPRGMGLLIFQFINAGGVNLKTLKRLH